MDTKKSNGPPTLPADLSPTSGEQIIDWEIEATAIINDIKSHVDAIEISRRLPCNERQIYLNVRTIEGDTFCMLVSGMGFSIVSHSFDTADIGIGEQPTDAEDLYETPYALLQTISPLFVDSFGNRLCQQLHELNAAIAAVDQSPCQERRPSLTKSDPNCVINE